MYIQFIVIFSIYGDQYNIVWIHHGCLANMVIALLWIPTFFLYNLYLCLHLLLHKKQCHTLLTGVH